MRLFVLGASGRTGTTLVTQGLERGHQVSAFGRSPYCECSSDALTIIPGSPLSVDDLGAALPDHDAVVSALGTRGLGPTSLLRDSARALTETMPHAGVTRLIVISSMLTARSTWLDRLAAFTLLRHHARDQREMEDIVAKSPLDWTVVRAPILTNRPLTGRYALMNDSPRDARASNIGRRDLARLMLFEVERGTHVRRKVGVVRTGS